MIKAIETQYRGYRFRSRLEARWAVLFDFLGIEWEYEKEGYELESGEYYLPDFFIPVDDRTYGDTYNVLEIKSKYPTIQEMKKCQMLSMGIKRNVYIVYGEPLRKTFGVVKHHTSGHVFNILPDDNDIDFQFFEFIYILLAYNPPPNDSKYALTNSVEAFRSARFEHGEAPRHA